MLNYLKSPDQKEEIFHRFDPTRQTWVVHDLRLKLDLQTRLLSKYGIIRSNSVMRVSELWAYLLKNQYPSIHLVDQEMSLTLIRQKISESSDPWAKFPGGAQSVQSYLDQLLPVINHSEGLGQLIDWFEQNPSAEKRWKHWLLESLRSWSEFVDRGWLLPKWAPAFLSTEKIEGIPELGELIVDVGAEIKPYELELFKRLSEFQSITVLAPDPSWVGDFPYLQRIYSNPITKSSNSLSGSNFENIELRRFPTMLGEVKEAVHWVRKQFESGVPFKEIIIAAPDISKYWPVLEKYLSFEGIPSSRPKTRLLNSLISVNRWTAYLQLLSGQASSDILETAVFESDKLISFEEFKRFYSKIVDETDLGRVQSVYQFVSSKDAPKGKIDLERFMTFSLAAWANVAGTDSDLGVLERVFKPIYQYQHFALKITLNEWIDYLIRRVARIEMNDGSLSDGVHCIDVSSCDSLSATRAFFLGVCDDELRRTKVFALSGSDIDQIERDLGFQLEPTDDSRNEFALRWILESKKMKSVLSFPESDFNGDPLAPSSLWLRAGKERQLKTEELSNLNLTRWDSEQRNSEALNLKYSETLRGLSSDRSDREFFDGKFEFPKLSASSVERYFKCPFVFFAEKILKLRDQNIVDLDLDRMTKGSLLHAVLKLAHEDLRPRSEKEKFDLIEAAIQSEKIVFGDSRAAAKMKVQMSRTIDRFVEAELNWIGQYGRPDKVFREEPFQHELKLGEDDFVVTIRGKIDRVDVFPQGALIIDYKSSSNNQRYWDSWIKNSELQLLIYSYLVEVGVLDKAYNVLGAVYYNGKNFSRNKGVLKDSFVDKLYPASSSAKISEEDWQTLKSGLLETLTKMAGDIRSKKFGPNPKNLTDCKDCRWKGTCRAKHLN